MIFYAERPGVDRWGPPERGTALLFAKNPWAPIAYDPQTMTQSIPDDGSALLAPERSAEMAYYLVQAAFSPEAWGTMLKKPHMPLEDLRPLLERLGGKLESCWLAFGEYDALLICQLPDQASAAALSMAASARGSCKNHQDHATDDRGREP